MTPYTDAATVAASLGQNAEATLSSQIVAGVTTLPLTAVPDTWAPGMYLALDYFNPGAREVVQITSAATSTSVAVTPTQYAHVAGSPIVECNGINDWIAAASLAINDFCYLPAGFGYESVTDTIKGYIDNDGYLVVKLSKPIVELQNVTSITFQPTPLSPVDTLNVSQAWIEKDFFLKAAPINSYYQRSGMATVAYSGGYNPIPADIQRAAVALAARFYKEKDSGFSDTIGSPELGLMTYKKAIPSDIKMMLMPHVRYV